MPSPRSRRAFAIPFALTLALTACGAPGALAPTTSSDAPEPAPTSSAESTPSPTVTLDTGAGPAPVADPEDAAEPAATPSPIPTSCADIDAAPLAAQWRAEGFVLEPFDGIIVGGAFPAATEAGGTLSVDCILWTDAGALGPHVLVELYRGADPAAVVAHPSLATYASSELTTSQGFITLVDSSGSGTVSSQETVGGSGDAVLRTFTVGMPLTSPGLTSAHAMVLTFESVFGSATADP